MTKEDIIYFQVKCMPHDMDVIGADWQLFSTMANLGCMGPPYLLSLQVKKKILSSLIIT